MSRALAFALFTCACGSDATPPSAPDTPPLPWPATAIAAPFEPDDNPTTPAKVELGRLLFYDPIVSADRAVACATCHSEVWGMSDGLALSIGVFGVGATGPGRTGPTTTRRNAQTLWNVAFREKLFWDGRAPSLEAQALEPLRAEAELGRDPDELALELATIPEYAERFAEAFPGEALTAAAFARAVAAFERTLVSRLAPYDRYAAGDEGALSEQAVKGMFLFAEAGCADCHTPPRFESERYAARGLVGTTADLGRFEVTANEADRGAFRVATLRNLRDSGPYFHDGSAKTLRDAVVYEFVRSNAEGQTRAFSEVEIDAVTSFLDKGLMDRAQNPDRPERVPSGLPVPVDGFRIPR